MKEPTQFDRSHFAHFALLPLLVFCEYSAYYGVQSQLYPHLHALGVDPARWTDLQTQSSTLGIFTPLLGGVMTAIFGPYVTLVLGNLLLGGIWIGLGYADAQTAPLWMVSQACALGLIKPAILMIAAVQFSRSTQYGRLALFSALHMAINIGGVAGVFALSNLLSDLGPGPFYTTMSAISGAIGLGAAGLGFIGRTQTWPHTSLAGSLPHAGIAALTAVLMLPPILMSSLTTESGFASLTTGSLSQEVFMGTLNAQPILVFLTGGALTIAALAAHLLQLRVPDLVFAGTAVFAAALAGLSSHPQLLTAVGGLGFAVSTFGLAICEAVAFPIALSRITAGSHWRLASVLISAWLVLSGGASAISPLLIEAIGVTTLLPVVAFFTGLAGLVLIGGAVATRDLLNDAE